MFFVNKIHYLRKAQMTTCRRKKIGTSECEILKIDKFAIVILLKNSDKQKRKNSKNFLASICLSENNERAFFPAINLLLSHAIRED